MDEPSVVVLVVKRVGGLVEIRSKALARAFVRLHLGIFVVNELFSHFPF